MTTTTPDPRIDRLYRLLPAIYRMRDAEQRYPLQALLRVMAEQVNLVEDDIAQLYENWFIETSDEWVVPYIADLIGYRPVSDAGLASDGTTREGRDLNRVLVPRREVANTIRYRRRKGTLALLELLARDVAGWPARAMEFFRLLGWNQHLDHVHLDRARTVDLHRLDHLDRLDGPFDRLAHTVDVRRINASLGAGRYNIPSVGVFVWRLQAYSVTYTAAHCAEEAGPHCYTFSVLGQDTPLFNQPEAETDEAHIAGEMNVPAPIRRLAFAEHPTRYYGPNRSVTIWADGWAGYDPDQPIPVSAIVAADLSDWQYVPPPKQIAVDPVLGRFAFPAGHFPKRGVRVSYHYGFSADIGGGEYPRRVYEPTTRHDQEPRYYRVGKDQQFQRLGEAVKQWSSDKPYDAVIELTDSAVYVDPLDITLEAGRTLQVRAASGVRPVIRLLDWQTDLPDALVVTLDRGSRFTLDGLLVTGRPLRVTGADPSSPGDGRAPICGSEIVIRHCTFVPGWAIDCDCEPKRPAEPSLQVINLRAHLRIEHSIVGSIEIQEDQVTVDPIPVCITDSIIDGTNPQKEAIGAPGAVPAHAVLTIARSTVFGIVDVHAIETANDCIFTNCVNVARRQLGCLRFCYVPPGCRTPRRYHCQPDLVTEALKARIADPAKQQAAIVRERVRVAPQFTSSRYGTPGYAQLGMTCAAEIARGAEDGSEMGVFHDLFQPQRSSNLRARLEEFTPAGMNVGLIFVS